jgi:hypothetical protein
MTMINFRRTGGSGKEMTIDFDLGSIPQSSANRLQNLLTESNFFDIPTINDLKVEPDEYAYTITVVAGNSLHTVHASDTSMPRSLRPFVEELTELAEATT